MCYCKLPSLRDYWSQEPSLGNPVVKAAISRDRFLLLTSKMYFSLPEKPADASKTYYAEDLLACLRYTFAKALHSYACLTEYTYKISVVFHAFCASFSIRQLLSGCL